MSSSHVSDPQTAPAAPTEQPASSPAPAAPGPALTKAGKRKHIRTGKRPPLPPQGEFTPVSALDHVLNLGTYRENAIRQVLGQPQHQVARETALGEAQSRRVGTICGMEITDFREMIRRTGQAVLAEIEATAIEDIRAMKPFQRQLVYGIRMDKYRDLTGGNAPTTVHQTNIQINGADRATALAALSGRTRTADQSTTASPPRATERPADAILEADMSEDSAQPPANSGEPSQE